MQRALSIESKNPEFQYALAVFYLERRYWEKAQRMADQLVADHPSLPAGRQLLEIIAKQKEG